MNTKIQNFFSCILLHLLAPLLPLLIEFIYTHDILARSVIMGASMYAILIGMTSKSQLIFTIGLFSSLLLAASYGAIGATESALPLFKNYGFYDIIIIFILHSIERFYRHVFQREPFFNFKTGEV